MFSAAEGHQIIPIYRTSFILRCWIGADEQVRILLINAQTGATYPIADLAELPAMLNSLIPAGLCVPDQDEPPSADEAAAPKDTKS